MWWEAGQSFYGGAARGVPGEIDQKFLRAIDLQTGKIAWELPQVGAGHSGGGVLSTAGGLIFFGDDSVRAGGGGCEGRQGTVAL